jgi:carbamoylphosphate synthase large subunit
MMSALEYAVDNMPEHKSRVIIEEYLAGGKEFSVESLSYEGTHKVVQITEKITSGPPHCVELGHIQPARISKEIRRKIEDAIPQLLQKVGVNNTTSHTEIKIIYDKIYLIELNARSGGDHISYPLTELSTGYPFVQGAINIAMGEYEHPVIDVDRNRCCGVIFVAKQTERFVDLFKKCEEYPWIYKKNKSTEELVEIVNNHCFDTNYFIFRAEESIPEEIECILSQL